mgnify:CR=1 FL=1
MANVSVLGAGSWGLGLALLLNNNGHNVTVWSVLKDEVAMLQTEREHKRCLPGVKIPDSITVSGDTENVIGSADVLVLAVASPYTRSTAKMIAPFVKEGQIIVNVAKGVEEHTLLTLCQIVEEEIPCAKVAVLSGPSHAEEVIKEEPFGMQLASEDLRAVELIRKAFNKANVYLPATDDLIGTQLGGALKNIIAIGYGIALEQGLGTNFYSMLVTAGMSDLRNLAVAGGAAPETLMGLGGLGDLITTIGSPYSRNRKFGQLLGSGISVEKALQQVGMVVEGVNAMEGALELAQEKQVSIPVINFINNIIKKRISPTKMKGLVQLLKGTY